MRSFHSIRPAPGLLCPVLLPLLLTAAVAAAQDKPPVPPGSTGFTVFLQGRPVGIEYVTVTRSASGVTVLGSNRLAAPINVVIRHAEAHYTPDWKPIDLSVDAVVNDQLQTVRTTFKGTVATNEIWQGGQTSMKTDQVAGDDVILANPWFGSYEAFPPRLAALQPGAELQAYIAPQAQVAVRFNAVTDERIETPAGVIKARRYQLTFANPGKPADVELWADESNRLLRVSVASQMLQVLRDDIATVAAREQKLTREGDLQVSIPANGFSLAGTISRPKGATPGGPGAARLPAVILVGGSGPGDRDETVAGVPIFAQLAGGLADAGFIVLRYDKRGIAQSGGRAEAATLTDFADDLRTVVTFMRKRKDVDPRRIAVLGHSEGGWVAMLAASKDDDITALVLVAMPAVTGNELVLEQQRHQLAALKLPEKEQQAKIELQKKIQHAVLTGTGWEDVPPELRRQADTPWFQSFLAFDPSKIVPRVRQPILIVQGDLDRQVPAAQADRLAILAKARKAPAGEKVAVVKVPGINHLLVPATTGEVDEYAQLKDKTVSAAVVGPIAEWLQKTLTPAPK